MIVDVVVVAVVVAVLVLLAAAAARQRASVVGQRQHGLSGSSGVSCAAGASGGLIVVQCATVIMVTATGIIDVATRPPTAACPSRMTTASAIAAPAANPATAAVSSCLP